MVDKFARKHYLGVKEFDGVAILSVVMDFYLPLTAA